VCWWQQARGLDDLGLGQQCISLSPEVVMPVLVRVVYFVKEDDAVCIGFQCVSLLL